MVAGELTKKTKATKAAILLHCAGPTAQDIYETFQWAEDADKDDVDQILAKFKNYCEPRKYETYNRFVFQDRVQREGETIDQWVTDLRKESSKLLIPRHPRGYRELYQRQNRVWCTRHQTERAPDAKWRPNSSQRD